MTSTLTEFARVRDLIDHVGAALDFYSTHVIFTVGLQGGVIGSGSGRTGAQVAAVVGLISVVIGGLAWARAAGRIGTGNGRAGAIVALVVGQIGINLGGLALARSRRTGNDKEI